MDNMMHWDKLRFVPANALKEIGFGKLKGKSDINPQWRYEVMTQEFGVCGIGWKYEITKTWTQEANDGQIMVFVAISLYVKDGDSWSGGIPAIGGDFLLEKDKNGLHGNDEAYKMATTDALGVAMKMLGVAADVYRGLANDSKYGRQPQQPTQTTSTQQKPQINTNTLATTQKASAAQVSQSQTKVNDGQVKSLYIKCTKEGLSQDDVHQLIKWKFNIESAKDLLIPDFAIVMNGVSKLWAEYIAEQSKKDGN